ncbi:hypothetical protein DNC80_08375 [Flavobacterium sp. SOK18b]|uniref:hypothetical protein n=1 Tax=unclassified Flavobacterium TaxID=196869 RepID=UPI0015FAF1AF|nr:MULTISPECIES: hypothetical protein [unclassified Flavobacterium]MBB1193680.1 hypothetical protein [Flavobacterium sp. SOK18b]CAH0336411.1 hypothetical protein FVB9288_02104 [Flavobacterium sp. CECT 9288]
MSQNSKKQFGVWMDSHHATIVGRENVDSGDFLVLGHETVDGQGYNTSENAANNAERDQLRKLFKSITAHMQNVDELHVTGTGTAQEQFINYLSEIPQYKNVVATESTSNKMTDQSLVEYFTAQFNSFKSL